MSDKDDLAYTVNTTKPVTPAMVQKYVEDEGQTCPFCGAEEPDRGDMCEQDTEDSVSQLVTCNVCGESWGNVYLLRAVDVFKDGLYHDTIYPPDTADLSAAPVNPAVPHGAPPTP